VSTTIYHELKIIIDQLIYSGINQLNKSKIPKDIKKDVTESSLLSLNNFRINYENTEFYLSNKNNSFLSIKFLEDITDNIFYQDDKKSLNFDIYKNITNKNHKNFVDIDRNEIQISKNSSEISIEKIKNFFVNNKNNISPKKELNKKYSLFHYSNDKCLKKLIMICRLKKFIQKLIILST